LFSDFEDLGNDSELLLLKTRSDLSWLTLEVVKYRKRGESKIGFPLSKVEIKSEVR
jgi:hypothetical protein